VRGLPTRLRERARGVRGRTTAAALIGGGAALLVAAVATVTLLRRSLTADVRAAAVARAQEIAGELRHSRAEVIPVGDEEDEFAQALDAAGRVVASSTNVVARRALVRVAPGEARTIEAVPIEDGPFLVVAVSAATPSGPLTVVVGRTLETVSEASRALSALLAAAIPLLLLVVGVVTWRVIGRALAPVEAVRAEVEAISTEQLHRRVPDPASRDEIGRLAATMNRMLERLELGHARQRRFVSDASHELRSPVTTIRHHAEVARSHPEVIETQQLADVVLEEDGRLERVVEDLLLLAKMDEGGPGAQAEEVDLDDLLLEEASRLRRATHLGIDAGGVSAARVLGDKRQLERVVRNLADNAARHARSRVAFSLGEADGHAVVAVDDDGGGIAPGERARVLERFVRLDEARDRPRAGAGSGWRWWPRSPAPTGARS
jgi:signal transduction histidine kinase